MARVVLDSGAVIALAARNPRARMVMERAIREGRLVILPAVVIAETTRGGARDAAVNRVINAVDEITPVTAAIARQAGRLLAHAGGTRATIDALIAAEAVPGGPATLLTGDPDDLRALTDGYQHIKVESL